MELFVLKVHLSLVHHHCPSCFHGIIDSCFRGMSMKSQVTSMETMVVLDFWVLWECSYIKYGLLLPPQKRKRVCGGMQLPSEHVACFSLIRLSCLIKFLSIFNFLALIAALLLSWVPLFELICFQVQICFSSAFRFSPNVSCHYVFCLSLQMVIWQKVSIDSREWVQ